MPATAYGRSNVVYGDLCRFLRACTTIFVDFARPVRRFLSILWACPTPMWCRIQHNFCSVFPLLDASHITCARPARDDHGRGTCCPMRIVFLFDDFCRFLRACTTLFVDFAWPVRRFLSILWACPTPQTGTCCSRLAVVTYVGALQFVPHMPTLDRNVSFPVAERDVPCVSACSFYYPAMFRPTRCLLWMSTILARDVPGSALRLSHMSRLRAVVISFAQS